MQRKESAVSVSNRKELNTEDYAFMKPLGEDGGEEVRERSQDAGWVSCGASGTAVSSLPGAVLGRVVVVLELCSGGRGVLRGLSWALGGGFLGGVV